MSNKAIKLIAVWGSSAIAIAVASMATKSGFPVIGLIIPMCITPVL